MIRLLLAILLLIPFMSGAFGKPSSSKSDSNPGYTPQILKAITDAKKSAECDNPKIVIFKVTSKDDKKFVANTGLYHELGSRHGYASKNSVSHTSSCQFEEFDLTINTPWHHEYKKKIIFTHDDVIILDDIELELITDKNDLKLSGTLWLEGGRGVVNVPVSLKVRHNQSYETVSSTRTNDKGEFVLKGLGSGRALVVANKKGYYKISEVINVEDGKGLRNIELKGYKERKLKVEWKLNKKGEKKFYGAGIKSGRKLIASGLGYKFTSGGNLTVGGKKYSSGDFFISQNEDQVLITNYYTGDEEDVGFYMSNVEYKKLKQVPDSASFGHFDTTGATVGVQIKKRQTYVFKTFADNNYVKMQILDIVE